MICALTLLDDQLEVQLCAGKEGAGHNPVAQKNTERELPVHMVKLREMLEVTELFSYGACNLFYQDLIAGHIEFREMFRIQTEMLEGNKPKYLKITRNFNLN
ncbi:22891_t:CDS:2 [Dentiscutata erythropus]|uniref:22891_t:CDS:1 n=1 Tax=Dentiscutata erythropus TaxID=1348616 RepID=A0A9N9GWL8_9GLOM|nr:22891_t:CDS:2 [Dentiscutata erythropus]